VKILIVDIETAPKTAYVWRFYKEFITKEKLLANGYIMSFAYKWLGSEDTHYSETRTEDDSHLCKQLCSLFTSADLVIAHNADKFDIPLIRARCLVHGINPWSPVKVVDTLKVAKREFLFDSNSLAFLAHYLGVEEKGTHKEFPGFELWAECLKGNPAAWREMKKYNIQDVDTLEEVYLRMRPWIRNHPNVAVHAEGEYVACAKCGSKHIQWRGYAYTNTGKYKKFQCQGCGGWGRTRFTEYAKDRRKELAVNAV